jgi:hypothetical protein
MKNQAAFDLGAGISGIASGKNLTQIISTPANSDPSGELTTPAEGCRPTTQSPPQLFGAALGDRKGTWARSPAPSTNGREHNAPRIGFEEPGGFGITIADVNMPLDHAHRSQTA